MLYGYARVSTRGQVIQELKDEEAKTKAENSDLSSALFSYSDKNTEKCYRAETKVKMTAEVLVFVERYHITKLDDFQGVVTNLYNQVATLRKEIRELQAEKKDVEEILRMSQQYKETLPVYKEWYGISNPKKKGLPMGREKVKVYIYARVSTSMQIDGYSLNAQKLRMKAFCDFNDYEIAGEYEDAGKFGKTIEGRIAFNQMLEDIKTGRDACRKPERGNGMVALLRMVISWWMVFTKRLFRRMCGNRHRLK